MLGKFIYFRWFFFFVCLHSICSIKQPIPSAFQNSLQNENMLKIGGVIQNIRGKLPLLPLRSGGVYSAMTSLLVESALSLPLSNCASKQPEWIFSIHGFLCLSRPSLQLLSLYNNDNCDFSLATVNRSPTPLLPPGPELNQN